MLRVVRLSLVGLLLLAGWVAVLQQTSEEPARTWVLLAPLLAIAAFGLYLVTALLFGVLTFRTVPEEAVLLQRDITRAKADLARRGIKY